MKRLVEIFFCSLILLLLSPILLLIVVLIKYDTKGTIFFFSTRVGINNSIYNMPKFRTMYAETEIVETSKLKDAEKKITKVGRILRKYSLDELPQFISVIMGKMTIVGPRPALPNQNELLLKRKKLGIHLLKPGITGYAQVNGRDMISLDKKISLEYEYVKKKSFFVDFLIIIKTLKVIFKHNEISH